MPIAWDTPVVEALAECDGCDTRCTMVGYRRMGIERDLEQAGWLLESPIQGEVYCPDCRQRPPSQRRRDRRPTEGAQTQREESGNG